MIGSTYQPQTWTDLEASKVAPNTIGATGTATLGISTNIDVLISDDSFIRKIEFFCKNHVFGDKVSITIIDIDNVYGYGAGFVMATPVTNWNITEDSQKQASYDAAIPKKIPGGTYLRLTYASVGLVDVSTALNLILLKALI